MSERLSDRNRRETEVLKATIAQKLGGIGVYHEMPRKAKKRIKRQAVSELEKSRQATELREELAKAGTDALQNKPSALDQWYGTEDQEATKERFSTFTETYLENRQIEE